MGNIIKFPEKTSMEKKSFTDFEEEFMETAKKEADDSAEFLWSCVLTEMASNDYDLERGTEQIKKASILVLESIRSLHYLTKGIEHPLQDIAMEIFEVEFE